MHTPGTTGIFLSRHHSTVAGFKPGDTINFAPAFTAFSASSGLITVPAPIIISGKASLIFLIASSAAAVLKVTSAHGIPPSIIAFASGTAFSASSIFTTGTSPML